MHFPEKYDTFIVALKAFLVALRSPLFSKVILLGNYIYIIPNKFCILLCCVSFERYGWRKCTDKLAPHDLNLEVSE